MVNGVQLNLFFFIASRQLLDHSNQTKSVQSAPLRYLEERMSTMEITQNSAPEQNVGEAIGVRISRRSLRPRNTSINYLLDNGDDALRGIMRRTISRPMNHTSSARQSGKTNEMKSIEKIYMKKSLGKVKTTNLETIFEDVGDNAASADGSKIKNLAAAFGLRKLQRRLTFSTTSITTTKAAKAEKAVKSTKRKKRVLLMLGHAKRFKKMSKQFFFDHLNALNSLHNKDDTKLPEVASTNDATTNPIAADLDKRID